MQKKNKEQIFEHLIKQKRSESVQRCNKLHKLIKLLIDSPFRKSHFSPQSYHKPIIQQSNLFILIISHNNPHITANNSSMIDHPLIYKRYTSQVKNNTILLLKQQQLFSSQQRQQQAIDVNKDANQHESPLIFKPQGHKNLEPIVLRKFQQYFKKNSQQNNSIRIFDRILSHNQHASTLSPKKIEKSVQPVTPITTRDLAKLISKDQNFVQANLRKQRKTNVYSSKSKHDHQSQVEPNQPKNISIIQQTIKDQKIYQTFSNPIHFISNKQQRRNQRFNKSTDLTILLNKTIVENNQKSMQLEKAPPSSSNDTSMMDFGYLKIQSSVLVDRKMAPPQPPLTPSTKVSKQEQLKKSIRTKLISRKRILEESYRQKIRSRSPSPNKIPLKMSFIQYINPLGKQQFTLSDVIKVSITNSLIDQVKMNMNGCFFSVYVAEGNNSDLIKAIVRSISGWRVAEIPEVANFVWTQSYRKNLMDKKPKKIIRDEILEEGETYRSKEKLIDAKKSPKSNRFNQTFLVSRNVKKGSDSNKLLKRKSLQKIELGSRSKITSISNNEANFTEISTKHMNTQQPYLYENELKKLLPASFDMQNFTIKNQKDSKKITITPNYLIHNHLIGHRSISDKKNLLFNLRKYYHQNQINPFNYIPESHDIINCDDQFIKKQNEVYLKEKEKAEVMKKEVWIVKPGEDSNRGRGIVVCKGWEEVVKEISKRVKEENIQKDRQQQSMAKQPQTQQKPSSQRYSSQTKPTPKKPPRTVILQRYILPLLYHGRKFDIRSYMLVTWVNNVLNGYVYEECYIRTSSKQFDIDSQNKYVHLTNDAIQNMSHQYGKYEEGNKVAQAVFAKYFDGLQRKEQKHWQDVKKEMAERCQHILKASSKKLVGKFGIPFSLVQSKDILPYHNESNLLKPQSMSPQQRKQKIPSLFLNTNPIQKQTQMSFQLFGLDFMIDQYSKLWLIQVNTNPAIDHNCSRVLGRLIPKLLENTFAIAVMPFMKPSRIMDSVGYANLFRHVYQEVIGD